MHLVGTLEGTVMSPMWATNEGDDLWATGDMRNESTQDDNENESEYNRWF